MADDRSTTDLLKQLSDTMRRLVRDEVELARIELTEKGKRAGLGAGLFSIAGVAALYGGGALVATVILGLAEVLPAWAAALIVSVLLFAGAAVAILLGRKQTRKATPPVPAEAVQSVQKDVEVFSERAHR